MKKLIVLILVLTILLSVGCEKTPVDDEEIIYIPSYNPFVTPTATAVPTEDTTVTQVPTPQVTPVADPTPENYFMYVVAESLNVRDKATTNSRIERTLPYGTKVMVFPFAEENGFCYVKMLDDGSTGYMSKQFLSMNQPKTTPKPTPRPTPKATAKPSVMATVAATVTPSLIPTITPEATPTATPEVTPVP